MTVRIPDEYADQVSAADPARLEQVALQAMLRAVAEGASDQPAMIGIVSNLSPQQAANQMRKARSGHPLPAGMSIHDLMAHGRA